MPVLHCTVSVNKLTSTPALKQSLVVSACEKPTLPSCWNFGPIIAASQEKEANAAFKFRKRKLKTVSGHTWISNE